MNARSIKRFRITALEGPSDRGTLNQFHDYVACLELDPGPPYLTEQANAVVTLFDTKLWSLASGDPRQPPYVEEGRSRIAHYLIEKMTSILPLPGAHAALSFTPTTDEILALRAIDPERVDVSGWHAVPQDGPPASGRVFISCGQRTEDEIGLGNRIEALVNENTRLTGYFAQNQQSLDGVTANIFNAIYTASGFIAVMHRRDQLPDGAQDFRGSVWVEQEIAIAAFLAQSLGRMIPSKAYVQCGIRREGVRGLIMLNPVEFSSHDQILADLAQFWPVLAQSAGR